jgi:uncharacterized LabA/DUF88 family protein
LRAAIFIDGGYLLNQLKNEKVNLDYSRFADFLLAPIRQSTPIDLLRCYFYYCAPWMSPEPTEDELRRMDMHNKFVEEIESIGRWQVRLGKLQKRWDGNKEYFEQKRVDVLLSCDLVRHAAAGHIQHAILVAGDSDFIPAVSASKESGVTLTVWAGPTTTVHKDLLTLADEVHHFNFRRLPLASGPAPTAQGPKPPREPEKLPSKEPRLPRKRRH